MEDGFVESWGGLRSDEMSQGRGRQKKSRGCVSDCQYSRFIACGSDLEHDKAVGVNNQSLGEAGRGGVQVGHTFMLSSH